MPTMMDAAKAMERVRATWGGYLPPALAKVPAEKIFVFCDKLRYEITFKMVFDGLFKKALGMPKASHDYVDGVFAFVSPFPHNRRKVYVSTLPNITHKILAHEYVHWLSHEAFYPDYYRIGGENPYRVEGITQWCTTVSGYDQYEPPEAYRMEWYKTWGWMNADPGNPDRALRFIFQGAVTDLGALHAATW
jgi:hypothetical protein